MTGRAAGRVAASGHGMARLLLLTGVAFALLLPAGPAAADPARPTHYRATITSIVDTDGQPLRAVEQGALDIEVLGGDAFLVVRAAPGVNVLVPGYEDEPYLRFTGYGTVEVNVRSPARWLNDARYGARDVQVPAQADAAAPPEWEVVAQDGTYAWHDHRIHVMTPALPAQVDPDAGTVQRVWDTVVPLEVDGEAAEVRLDLDWIPGPSPLVAWPPVLVLAIGLAALLLVRPTVSAVVLGVVALATLAIGGATWLTTPSGGDVEPALIVLPVLALGLLAVAAAVGRRQRVAGRWLGIGAALPLAVWGILLAPALVRPIVPGPVPIGIVRGVTAAALATGAAALVVAVRRLLTEPG
jgi:hypothetical protein